MSSTPSTAAKITWSVTISLIVALFAGITYLVSREDNIRQLISAQGSENRALVTTAITDIAELKGGLRALEAEVRSLRTDVREDVKDLREALRNR